MGQLSKLSKEQRIFCFMIAASLIGGFLFSMYQVQIHNGINTYTKIDWATITSKDPNFSLLLPPNARHVVDDKRNNFSAEDLQHNIYTATIVNYGDQTMADQNKFLLELEKLLHSRLGNKLLTTEDHIIDGRPSRNFIIEDSTSGWYTRGFILLDKQTVYVLAVLYPHNAFDSNGYQKFIDSFKLKNSTY